MNNSLFPDANANSTAWTGPPPGIVAAQSLLYASLTTSLFAAFLAMLGKQWVNRYLRNRGGSAADKSRDRQRKLDGFEKWHFHLAIESLPVMLQLALLLLGCALSMYLWTISRTVAGVVVAVTIFGLTSYLFLTLAATLYYNCPYQTPPSTFTRTVIRYLTHSNATFARSLRSLIALLPSIRFLGRILGQLGSGVCSVLRGFGRIPAVAQDAEHIPLAVVLTSPVRIFEDVSIDWEVCKADARCISWVLDSTTDTDVIFSTTQFVTDIIWYPQIVGALSPHILADLFLDCLVEQVTPGKLEYASSIGMALASVLSVRLSTEPENQALRDLCERIRNSAEFVHPPEPVFTLVVAAVRFVADTPTRLPDSMFGGWWFFETIPDHLSMAQKLWLSRVILQTLWRWRGIQEPIRVLNFSPIQPMCKNFTADNDQTFAILKTNCFLTMAISLGLTISIRPQQRVRYPPLFPVEFAHQVVGMHCRWLPTFSANGYKYVLGMAMLTHAI